MLYLWREQSKKVVIFIKMCRFMSFYNNLILCKQNLTELTLYFNIAPLL